MPFEAFLMWLHIDARARNDTEWVKWYKEWLKDLPEGDGREDYIEKSRADYERRMGETVEEHLDRTRKERFARLHKVRRAERRAERTKEYVEEATNHQIMVENFKMFQREYVDMTIRRCG